MNLFAKKKPNLESVTESLIKTLKVKVNSETISQSLQDHPDYPSMLSIVDCLNDWNLATEVYNIKRAEYDRDDLLFPFIAHLKDKGGRFILIHNINDHGVKFSDEEEDSSIITEEEFLNRWDGIALRAEKNENSAEKDYSRNRLKYLFQNSVLPLGLILVLVIFYLGASRVEFSFPYLLLSVIKLAGLGVSVLLLMQSINSNNPFIQNLCTFGKKNNCNAILKSDAAKVTSWMSWSEVGFFYFSGSLILLMVYPVSINLLAWLNVLALPYIIYSIGYQYRAKNWCVLCCTVQALLALEFIISIGFNLFAFSFSLSAFVFSSAFSFGLLALSFLSPIIIWTFLKPFFLDAAQVKPLKQQLKRFKYNSELFQQALTNQPRYAVNDELMPITMGNTNAENVITMVSNPFCGPCGKAHETIEELLNTRSDLKLKVIFSTHNPDDERTKVAKHLTAFGSLGDGQKAASILSDWYQGEKKYNRLMEKYPLNYNGEIDKGIENQKNWCKLAEITHTPTIFINGYKLPEPYRLEDIKYLIT